MKKSLYPFQAYILVGEDWEEIKTSGRQVTESKVLGGERK